MRRPGRKLRLHDLRHSFGTLAVQLWPISDVKAYMGYASVTTTEMYTHHQTKANAANQLSEFVRRATELPDDAPPVVAINYRGS